MTIWVIVHCCTPDQHYYDEPDVKLYAEGITKEKVQNQFYSNKNIFYLTQMIELDESGGSLNWTVIEVDGLSDGTNLIYVSDVHNEVT